MTRDDDDSGYEPPHASSPTAHIGADLVETIASLAHPR
jgi:hypothetical protein